MSRGALRAGAALLAAGCSSVALEALPIGDDDLAGQVVTYGLAWDWEGVADADGARTFETDLGYRVTLTRAELSTSRLELVPCPATDTGLASSWWWPIPVAYADHPVTDADSSRWESIVLEDVLVGATITVTGGLAGDHAYCDLNQLFFADEGPVVALAGTFTTPAGEVFAFDVEGVVGSGALVPLGDLDLPSDGPRAQVVRHPARALDGLPLEELTEAELAWEFVRGLADGADAWLVGDR